MFDLEHILATTYPGLTPFEIEQTPLFDVVDLFADLRRMQIRENEKRQEENGEKIIRRRASDDAGWW